MLIERMKFQRRSTRDGAGAPRRARARARPRRDAGVHAGRHLRHGEGDDARRARRRSARRSCSATPSTCGCGPGLEVIGKHGGLHRFMGWERPDPHRLGRLPGLQPRRRCARSPRKACSSPRRSTATACSSRPRSRCASSACSIPTSPWCSTSARRIPATEQQAARLDAAVAALGRALEDAHARQRERAVRHRAGRHVRDAARRVARRARRRSASTATRSAGCRWASRRRTCARILAHIAPRLPAGPAALPDGRGHARGHRRGGRARASTCSTACCRRATRATAGSSRATATSSSATRATATTRRRSTRAAPATPAATSPAPTCYHLQKVNEILGARLNTLHNLHYYQELMRGLRAAIESGTLGFDSAKRTAGRAASGCYNSRVFSRRRSPQ